MSDEETVKQRRWELGRAIYRIRRRSHISQEKLAYMADTDRAYMGRIERGEQSVSLDKIWAICDALQITPVDLFQEAYRGNPGS